MIQDNLVVLVVLLDIQVMVVEEEIIIQITQPMVQVVAVEEVVQI